MVILINNQKLYIFKRLLHQSLSLCRKMEEKLIFNNVEFYKIENFEGYYVSSLGQILSVPRKYCNNYRILKFKYDKNNYSLVKISINAKRIMLKVHRIVAKTFIPNIENKPQVNHINGIKTDNRVENLEWVTNLENNKHSWTYLNRVSSLKGKFGKDHPFSKKVNQYDLNNNYIRSFDCLKQITRELGFNFSFIASVCRGERKKAYNYIWRYENGKSK